MTSHRLALSASALLVIVSAFPTLAADDDFPDLPDSQELTLPLLDPGAAREKMELPEGFRSTIFAAEPEVRNPIACAWDEKGRLWVAENFTYGDREERFNLDLRDRILVFEDSDRNGVHDRRSVFTDQLQMLTSIERGLGGVWALCPPHLLFLPDADGDDVPDGPPVVKLEGFSTEAASRHTFANGLKWGPDGWLYGRIGISSTSRIGPPGSDPEDRPVTAGGLWRYHPVREAFDLVCAGTTNPWGHDWNEDGELFFINTVIGHLWHGVHGAHFERMHGQDPNPRTYRLLDQIADHYHWDTGKKWTDSRDTGAAFATADQLGGGHAHVGMAIYQGTNWPERFRGKVLTLNLHGRRVNVERLERQDSGYVGKHEPDILKSSDPWFRGVEITYGPDGGVYILDWSDIGECHENDGVHRNSGRIHKITHGEAEQPGQSDLTQLSDADLAALQTSDNEWLVRMARWELRERAWRGEDLGEIWKPALAALREESTSPKELRNTLSWLAMTLECGNPRAEAWHADYVEVLGTLSTHPDETVQAAALRQLLVQRDGEKPTDFRKAMGEVSAAVLDSLIQRVPSSTPSQRRVHAEVLGAIDAADRPALAAALLARAEDADDPRLPLLYWYGIMDLPPETLAGLFADCRIPLVRRHIARRCAEDIESNPGPLNLLLTLGRHHEDLLLGMNEALEGWASAEPPEAWEGFVERVGWQDGVDGAERRSKSRIKSKSRSSIQNLSLLFGDGRALDDIRRVALDEEADLHVRRKALASLITARPDDLRALCEKLLKVRGLGPTAMRGLALYDDPAAGNLLAARYRNFYPHDQAALIGILVSRPSFARALLRQMEAGRIPRRALTARHARQIQRFGDENLDSRLAETWGILRESSGDKQQRIDELKKHYTPEVLARGDRRAGRVLFQQACASCHTLFGEGNHIGPDLTGGGRRDLAYLVENIVDPSALVAPDYRMTVLTMKDGQVLAGNVAARTERTTTLKMVGMEQVLENDQIAESKQEPVSMMPEGLLGAFSEEQVRDLFAYLMGEGQVEVE